MSARGSYRLVFTAAALLSLTLPASGEGLDPRSRVGLHCATVLHGLARASRQDNFEDAGFSQADVSQYQGRADFWYGWVAKRVGRPRGQLEQRTLSDTGHVGELISIIAADEPRNLETGALFGLLGTIVQTCAAFQDDVARGGDLLIKEFPSGWPPAARADSGSR